MAVLTGDVLEQRDGHWRVVHAGGSIPVNDRRRVDSHANAYRCWTCKEPIVRGERCTCGRGWFVERVQ